MDLKNFNTCWAIQETYTKCIANLKLNKGNEDKIHFSTWEVIDDKLMEEMRFMDSKKNGKEKRTGKIKAKGKEKRKVEIKERNISGQCLIFQKYSDGSKTMVYIWKILILL